MNSYETYAVSMRSWPGVNGEARARVVRQLKGAKSNGQTAFRKLRVSLNKDKSLTVSYETEAQGPFDATDFGRYIIERELARLAENVFQDGPDEEESWCASVNVKHWVPLREVRA